MLKDYIAKQPDYILWQLLADVGEVMRNNAFSSSNEKAKNTEVFWITVASEIVTEIDKRLFVDYDSTKDLSNVTTKEETV